MNKTERTKIVLAYLAELFPTAGCELNYQTPAQLVIAVMLSAQTTDQSVNRVTTTLFARYPTLESLAAAQLIDIEETIKSIGLFHTKARNIIGIAQALIARFDGQVPHEKADLMSLPGIGNKSANVIRAEIFHIPEIAVDTHVHRVSRRLGLAGPQDNVDQTEKKLRALLPTAEYINTHHRLIHFGRYFCLARQPHCYQCRLVELCQEKNKNLQPK